MFRIQKIALSIALCVACIPKTWASGFLDFCKDKNKSADVRYTLDILAKYAGGRECETIKDMLESIESIEIAEDGLIDVKAFSFFDNILEVFLSSNSPIKLRQLADMKNLIHIRVKSPLKVIEKLPPNIEELWVLGANDLTLPSLQNYKKLSDLHFFETTFEELDFLRNQGSITYLTIQNGRVKSIDEIPAIQTLEVLDLDGNLLTSIDGVIRFPKLASIYLDGNAIQNIEGIAELPNLKKLSVGYNKKIDLSPLSKLPSLKGLYLEGLSLGSLPNIGVKPNLAQLDLSNNNLSDISSIAAHKHLRELDLSHNRLVDVEGIHELSKIHRLWLASNSISHITKLPTSVFQLSIDGNGITSLDWLIGQELPNLYSLSLDDNFVEDLSPISHLKSLGGVDFERNRVRTLAGIETLDNLLEISGKSNRIEDISALAKNQYVFTALLDGNLIEDISVLKSKKELYLLGLSENPLGTIIAKTEDNCPTQEGPQAVVEWCSNKSSNRYATNSPANPSLRNMKARDGFSLNKLFINYYKGKKR